MLYYDTMENKRLNKAIADTGFCSRRKADDLIFAGNVCVNGIPEQNPGRRVIDGDIISINGVRLTSRKKKPSYFMLHKPVQTVCTLKDPQGRQTILEGLPPHLRQIRLYPIGRLDFFSEGLLLLTNDGSFANRLMHPRYRLAKIYEVIVRGPVATNILADMKNGMTLEDGTTLLPVEVQAQSLAHGNTLLTMTLYQGVNRQIRRMCDRTGLVILRLKRIAQGPLSLGNLKSGQIRPLTQAEIVALKRATGYT